MQERRELTEEEKAYKPITENPIQIDLGSITDKFSLCRLLKQKLGLPDFCGESWDAIRDLAWGFSSDPVKIEFYGVEKMRQTEPSDIQIMLKIFGDIHTDFPHIEYEVID